MITIIIIRSIKWPSKTRPWVLNIKVKKEYNQLVATGWPAVNVF